MPVTVAVRAAAIVVSLFLLLALADSASAAVITADPTAQDDNNGSFAGCSLREAILSANGNTSIGGCVAGSGADQINLPAGTYTLTRAAGDDNANTGDLDITSPISFVGAAANTTTIQQTVADRVFHIPSGANTVSFTDLTITGGNTHKQWRRYPDSGHRHGDDDTRCHQGQHGDARRRH
jgi:CSLREA domain-containing protein